MSGVSDQAERIFAFRDEDMPGICRPSSRTNMWSRSSP